MVTRVISLEVSGFDYTLLAFAVSSGAVNKCLERTDMSECIRRYVGKLARNERLPHMLARYPQVMEFTQLWGLVVAPKFVVDHLVRHRLASWMVSSVRHGDPVVSVDDYGEPIRDLAEKIAREAEWLRGECLKRKVRGEICNRFIPPLVDHRTVLLSTNLREFAHIYCIRVREGGQYETRELLEEMLSRLRGENAVLAEAVRRYCELWY